MNIIIIYLTSLTSLTSLVQFVFDRRRFCQRTISPAKKKYYTAIGNVELMHECFPKHSHRGTTRMKYDNETQGEGKKRRVYGKK